MNPNTRKVLLFIIKVSQSKGHFFFWLFVRFVSAILPLVTIYQFSYTVKLIESQQPVNTILWSVFWIFAVRIADNYLRLKSLFTLEQIISNMCFDLHNFFLSELKTETKEERHATVQAIRNFADASSMTLNLIKQPGIDSLVSVISIPILLFLLDFPVFVISLAYMVIYYFIDIYTTQKYTYLKDILFGKTEVYYAKLQESNDFDLEQKSWARHFSRCSNWGFIEWFLLQNTAVIFYSLILFYLVYTVITGQKHLSDLVLIIGYVSQIQVLLNSLSQIKDSLADMFVGLQHLAKNTTVSAVDLEDLI